MGLIATLDMGSEKMVMALAASDSKGDCRLTGIKFTASQGVQQGVITDQEKAQTCIRSLMNELLKDRVVETLNISLSGRAVKMSERKVNIPLQRKVVESGDLVRAEIKCAEGLDSRDEELIDLLPVAYSVDRGELIADPIGKHGRNLEVYYQAYTADNAALSGIRKLLDGYNIREINFFPLARVYGEAVDAEMEDRDFALVDLGAMSTKVTLFRGGLLEYEAVLPLGVRTIDNDITSAFGIDGQKARKLKHEYGQALRSVCKNKKLVIPDTKLTIESRDLATVVQSRMEELLEGVVFLLQGWGFEKGEDEILLTGGGSRLMDVDVLLQRLSGHRIARASVKRVQSSKEEVLRTPEYLVALGLLLCNHEEPQETKSGLLDKLKGLFG